MALAVRRVDDPTPVRRRVHFDTSVDDLEAAAGRIVQSGGSHVEDQEMDGFAWKVMADPEGNEFCIAPGG